MSPKPREAAPRVRQGSAGDTFDPIVVSAIIEDAQGRVLVARSSGDAGGDTPWELPRGRLRRGETPEGAMRRVAKERLDLGITIDVGQPPVNGRFEGESVVYRYFLAGVVTGDARASDYAEVRWVPRLQLREYEFDPATSQVVAWYAHA
jgi:8-oxo-dGTP diphosphatase